MKYDEILKKLDIMIPNPKCELEFNKDYELLIATVLSAQCTDKRVNEVTKILFSKYDIFSLAKEKKEIIEPMLYPLGSYTKKTLYIIKIAESLVRDYDGKVPNNRIYLENLNGVGRKTCNVVLAELFGEPSIAVDTHVKRVSVRLNLANSNDDVLIIEKKLMKKFPKDKWIRLHHQLVLFGRYICKSKKPECSKCLFKCKQKVLD